MELHVRTLGSSGPSLPCAMADVLNVCVVSLCVTSSLGTVWAGKDLQGQASSPEAYKLVYIPTLDSHSFIQMHAFQLRSFSVARDIVLANQCEFELRGRTFCTPRAPAESARKVRSAT